MAVGEAVPREMYSDEQRLQQILRNLLSNAIKFTAPAGSSCASSRITDPDHCTTGENSDDVIAFAVATPASASPPRNSR